MVGMRREDRPRWSRSSLKEVLGIFHGDDSSFSEEYGGGYSSIEEEIKVSGSDAEVAIRIDIGRITPENFTLYREKAEKNGFDVDAATLATMVEKNDKDTLIRLGRIHGLAAKLQVTEKRGVSEDETDIQRRKEVFGSNTYPEKPPKGFFAFVWEAMQDRTLMIVAVCALVSLAVGIPTEGLQEGWYDGAGIGFSIILVVLVTAASDYQQSLQFRDLDAEKKKIFIQVTRSGCRKEVSIYDLVVGDIVHLSIGNQVPADGVLIRGYELTIDESSMTGESLPRHKSVDRDPFLLSGTKVQDGSGVILVTSVGMNTEWGHLMSTLSEAGDTETPLQVKLNGLATFIGKLGLLAAILTFLVLMIRFLVNKQMREGLLHRVGDNPLAIVNFFATAVTLSVVAVPEGLPLAVTLTLAYAMKKMIHDKALVRHLAACETMGSVTTICSDKTGTLTTNKMVVTKAWIAGEVGEVSKLKSGISPRVREILIESIFMNTSGDVGEPSKDGKCPLIGTPTETAVLDLGVNLGGQFQEVRAKSEVVKVNPFNSERKRMGVLVRCAQGEQRAHWKGASEIVLGMCDRTADKDGNVVPLDDVTRGKLVGVIANFAHEALRTLCLGYKVVESHSASEIPESHFVCIAIVGIKDPVRPGVPEAVKLCFAAGIKVRMVTGDNIDTAKAIARECGILTDGIAVEGPDFRTWNDEQMKERIPKLQVMARSSPRDKITLVKWLRSMDEVVAVTGDGTNDAPALKEADIGMARGTAGTEVAKESADIIIMDDNFNTIVVVGKWGRAVYTNIQKSVQFHLTMNLSVMAIRLISACFTGESPLTAVQLLWVNVIGDIGALALATQPPHDDLMKKAPTGRKAKFITNIMWRNIIGQVVYQLVVLTILQIYGIQWLQLPGEGEEQQLSLTTMIFSSFVFCQVFNEMNARAMEKINIFAHALDNWFFVLIIGFTVFFQWILVTFLGKFAHTVPLTKQQWGIAVGIGAGSSMIAVGVKCIPLGSKPWRNAFTNPTGVLTILQYVLWNPVAPTTG
ncbi:hypothetical protein AXG93_93s1240 [Marchantia polymorpha subsp. ruderalis]|uniref:Calcium-transporting ATPase n=1 Tax=Marchantia polymorpha subsp. ruderalis TaxID=1480154 RepID=A0A176WTZ6_MARPO|nr:hypothetical protein AXG93_93s1240 [Marchantia polymorpha subsp. ruderalis]